MLRAQNKLLFSRCPQVLPYPSPCAIVHRSNRRAPLPTRASWNHLSISTVQAGASQGVAILLAAAMMLLPAEGVQAEAALRGQARIVDGDTLVIGTEKFRLYGVSAAEPSSGLTVIQSV